MPRLELGRKMTSSDTPDERQTDGSKAHGAAETWCGRLAAVSVDGWNWLQHVVDHLELHASDYDQSVRFYATVLTPLGLPHWSEDTETERATCFTRISVVDRRPATTGSHLCFVAKSRDEVDAFHQAGVEVGFSSNGSPGLRDYGPGYYAAFLFDPDGNNVEALYRDVENRGHGWDG